MKLMRLVGISLLTLMAFAGRGQAENSFWLEPQVGFRSLSGDPGDVLQAGPMVGGIVGFRISPVFALTGLLDLAFHSPKDDASVLVENGVTFMIAAGGRVYPMGNDQAQSLQPFLGAGIGRSGMGLSYKQDAITELELLTGESLPNSEGFGAWVFSLEGGGDLGLSENLFLGGSARFNLHAWDSKSSEGFSTNIEGNTFQASARLGIRL